MPIVPPPDVSQSLVPSCELVAVQGIAIVPDVTSWKMQAGSGELLLSQFSAPWLAASE